MANAANNVRLKVSNGLNTDETIILFDPNASNTLDAYDSEKMFAGNPDIAELYTYASSTKVVINGLKSVETNQSIALGFLTAKAGIFTIYINQINGLSGVPVILEDKLLHKNIDLRLTPSYVFTSNICDDATRFTLHFVSLNAYWNGTDNWTVANNWTASTLPVVESNVIVSTGELIINQDLEITNLTVNPGAKLTVNQGKTLRVYGNLSVLSDITGTGTIVDIGNLTVNGTSTVQQYLTGSGTTSPNGRFWYISSPVSGATSAIFDALGADVLKNYDETTHSWNEIIDNTSTLPIGIGYFARLGANTTISFNGPLNSGNSTLLLSRSGTSDAKRGFNLIGNSYPSYLDWEAAYATGVNVNATMWYRTNNGSSMVFDTYNAALHVGTSNNGNATVTKYIPPMQAFWVLVDGDGATGSSISFDNTMRSHQTSNLLKADAVQEVIRLQVANETNSDETIIVFNTNSQNTFDEYDSEKMFNTDVTIPELYTVAENTKLTINGLESIESNQEIALGFKTATAGTYTITAKTIEGLEGLPVVLEDKLLGKTQDLTVMPTYIFTSVIADNASRFVLKLKSATLDVNNVSESGILVYTQGKTIVVATSVTAGVISITDVLGRIIAMQPIEAAKTTIAVESDFYIVKVATSTGIETYKVIVE